MCYCSNHEMLSSPSLQPLGLALLQSVWFGPTVSICAYNGKHARRAKAPYILCSTITFGFICSKIHSIGSDISIHITQTVQVAGLCGVNWVVLQLRVHLGRDAPRECAACKESGILLGVQLATGKDGRRCMGCQGVHRGR